MDVERLTLELRQHRAELDRELEMLRTANARLVEQMTALEAQLPPKLENGTFPSFGRISRIECQIFHSPDLTPTDRRTKTEWSLRLSVWLGHRKANPEINVRLFPHDALVEKMIEKNGSAEIAAVIRKWGTEDDTMLAGMVQAFSQGKGRARVPSQIATLSGRLVEQPKVLLVLDEPNDINIVEFRDFAAGKGTKAGRARWYAHRFV